jgi:hypothetical protein
VTSSRQVAPVDSSHLTLEEFRSPSAKWLLRNNVTMALESAIDGGWTNKKSWILYIYIYILVGGFKHVFIFHFIWGVILPFNIFQDG